MAWLASKAPPSPMTTPMAVSFLPRSMMSERILRGSAQRQAYSSFARPFGDAAGKHTTDTHSGKRQGRDSKCFEENERELPFRVGKSDPIIHGIHTIDWQIFVDRPDCISDVRRECGHVAAR